MPAVEHEVVGADRRHIHVVMCLGDMLGFVHLFHVALEGFQVVLRPRLLGVDGGGDIAVLVVQVALLLAQREGLPCVLVQILLPMVHVAAQIGVVEVFVAVLRTKEDGAE